MFGGVDAFDAMVFGQAHPGTLNFLTQQYQQLTQSAANLVGQAKDLFLSTVCGTLCVRIRIHRKREKYCDRFKSKSGGGIGYQSSQNG